jgi:hypothetical protein
MSISSLYADLWRYVASFCDLAMLEGTCRVGRSFAGLITQPTTHTARIFRVRNDNVPQGSRYHGSPLWSCINEVRVLERSDQIDDWQDHLHTLCPQLRVLRTMTRARSSSIAPWPRGLRELYYHFPMHPHGQSSQANNWNEVLITVTAQCPLLQILSISEDHNHGTLSLDSQVRSGLTSLVDLRVFACNGCLALDWFDMFGAMSHLKQLDVRWFADKLDRFCRASSDGGSVLQALTLPNGVTKSICNILVAHHPLPSCLAQLKRIDFDSCAYYDCDVSDFFRSVRHTLKYANIHIASHCSDFESHLAGVAVCTQLKELHLNSTCYAIITKRTNSNQELEMRSEIHYQSALSCAVNSSNLLASTIEDLQYLHTLGFHSMFVPLQFLEDARAQRVIANLRDVEMSSCLVEGAYATALCRLVGAKRICCRNMRYVDYDDTGDVALQTWAVHQMQGIHSLESWTYTKLDRE